MGHDNAVAIFDECGYGVSCSGIFHSVVMTYGYNTKLTKQNSSTTKDYVSPARETIPIHGVVASNDGQRLSLVTVF